MLKRTSNTRAHRFSWAPCAATGFGLGLFAITVQAEPAESAGPAGGFTWERGPGAETCLSEADLQAKIAGMLGKDPFAGSGAPAVHATVVLRGENLFASVQVREADSSVETTRQFQVPGPDCAALTDAVALAITLALSPDARADNEGPPPSPTPPPASVSTKEFRVAPSHADGVSPWTALAEVAWTLGALPRPVAGLGLELRYAVAPRFALAFGGDWLPSASEAGQFSVSLVRARLGACFEPFRDGAFALSACGSGEGGAIHVANEVASLPSAGSHSWFGAGLTARASARLAAAWVVEVGAGAIVPTSRPIYATPSCPLLGFQEPAALLTVLISTGVLF